MGITDFFSDLMASVGLQDAYAEAPAAEEEDNKDGGGDEGEEEKSEEGDGAEEQKGEGGDEGSEEEEEEEEAEAEEEEEEEEDDEPVDPKPKLEAGQIPLLLSYGRAINELCRWHPWLPVCVKLSTLTLIIYRMRQIRPMRPIQTPLR